MSLKTLKVKFELRINSEIEEQFSLTKSDGRQDNCAHIRAEYRLLITLSALILPTHPA